MHGRIVPSRSERALSFDDGTDYTPTLPGMAGGGRRSICGPLGLLRADHRNRSLPLLRADADGRVVTVPQKPVGRPT